MNFFDASSETEEKQRQAALKYRKPELVVTGFCFNCSDACRGVFCSVDCREDYEAREYMRNRNGR